MQDVSNTMLLLKKSSGVVDEWNQINAAKTTEALNSREDALTNRENLVDNKCSIPALCRASGLL